MLLMMPLLVSLSLIRNLKYLAPCSMLANFLIASSIGITMWYVFEDLPPIESVSLIAPVEKWPIFFGTAIFALEGIGVVSFFYQNI